MKILVIIVINIFLERVSLNRVMVEDFKIYILNDFKNIFPFVLDRTSLMLTQISGIVIIIVKLVIIENRLDKLLGMTIEEYNEVLLEKNHFKKKNDEKLNKAK